MNRIYINSWNDALDIVHKDCSINFITRAVTPWNALSIDALIMSMLDKGVEVHAMIVIAEHYQAGYMIDETNFINSCSKYVYLPWSKVDETSDINKSTCDDNIYRRFNYYKLIFGRQQGGNVLYYNTFNHSIPDAVIVQQLKCLERVIVVCHSEEGVGAYMGTFDKSYPPLCAAKNLQEVHSYLRNVFWGRTVYRNLHKSYSSLTLNRTIFGLSINNHILQYYREVFRELNHRMHMGLLDVDMIQKSVVICTTAWRRKEVEDNEDLKVLKKVCRNLRDRGLNMLLKTHPRDTFFRTKAQELQCCLIDFPGLSMECLCEYANPKAVISFSSTTLINPRIFWGIPVYCLTDMLDRSKISKFYLEEIDSFKRTFRKFVSYVDTPNAIKL